jgi:hypothetical protein
MTVPHKNETAHAHSAITAAGFKVSDFAIEGHQDDPLPSVETYPITGTVTVTRRNGVSKTYAVGTMSSWVAEFVSDVEAGVYGLA